jgi:RNA polymerase sigma factor (sigma-70 family)
MTGGSPLGDERAILLRALALRYRKPLWGFFEKRIQGLGPADTEDLVQEVFVRLAQRADLAAVTQIEGYLFQTAANLLRDRARRAAVRGPVCRDAEFSGDDEVITPERVLQGKETLERAIAALHELPERTRMVFVLHRFEELSYAEISQRARISPSAVEKHMMKAMAHLKRRLATEVGEK